ncbi:hypothetical protein PVAND_009651 [Polypedilum vanderplanki]|uniref:Serine/threonine-protein kinase ATR n=1 Tax=Polypedilum vanderplanki TaxID=319348 RepID=A0A9J6CES6_POLVA|nr:hypothetical protein PVAND_009651 [Polypedilum vanderplanki]
MAECTVTMPILRKLNDLFVKFIKNDSKNGIFFEKESLEKVLYFLNTNFLSICNDITSTSLLEEREHACDQLSWIFSKLLFITLHDNNNDFTQQVQEITSKILPKGQHLSVKWFHKLTKLHLDLLNKSLEIFSHFEINIPRYDIENNTLLYSKSVINDEIQFEKLIPFCLYNLGCAIDLAPATIASLSKYNIPEIVLKIFDDNEMQIRISCIIFLTIYYKNTETSGIDCFKLIENISNTYRIMTQNDNTCGKSLEKAFDLSIVKLVKLLMDHIKSFRINLNNSIITEKLIATVIKLIYFELKFKEQHRLTSNTALFIEFIYYILITIDSVDENYIKSFKNIQHLCVVYDKILLLSQFQIILEIEQACNFSSKLTSISPTWNKIHNTLLEKVNSINDHMTCDEEYEDTISWINTAFLLAQNINFLFIFRHQLMHERNKLCPICERNNISTLSNDNLMMKFNDWSYQHIQLDFFDDLSSLIHQLIQKVKFKSWFYGSTINLMNIFTSVFSFLPKLTDEDKLFMMTVIILPFYNSIEKYDKMNKSAEFKKMQNASSHGMKMFSKGLSLSEQFEFKRECIRLFAQLRLNKINSTSMWLKSSFMRLVFTEEGKDVQFVFLQYFKDMLITNFEVIESFLSLYQSLRLNQSDILQIKELKDILCLTDKNVIILKTRKNTYDVLCEKCSNDSNEMHVVDRYLMYISKHKSYLMSICSFDKDLNISINSNLLNDKTNEFYAHFIKNIPPSIEHSIDFIEVIDNKGEILFNIILKMDENILKETNFYQKNIILSIQRSKLSDNNIRLLFENFLEKFSELTLQSCQNSGNLSIQYYIANMIATLGSNMKNSILNIEKVSLKCLKLLIYFMIIGELEVKGVAINLAFRMLEQNGIIFQTFLNWYKKSLLDIICTLCLSISLDEENFTQNLFNFLKNVHISEPITFVRSNIHIIIGAILPFCVENNQFHHIRTMLKSCKISLNEAIRDSSFVLHEMLYSMENNKKKYFIDFIENNIGMSFKELLQLERSTILERACAKYCNNQSYVINVVQELGGDEKFNTSDLDKIADYIATKFLAVLNYFENELKSTTTTKALKHSIILSLGDFIRFLGERISNLYFKIMSILKEITKLTDINGKESCIEVWKIFALHCNSSTIGSFLSVIFVSLEDYLNEYPQKVENICLQFINNNASLLSRYFPDLFFITKTRHSDAVKNAILHQIQSQRHSDKNEFELNLELLLKHLKNENTDSDVKFYLLLYLEDLIKNDRKKFNEFIFSHSTIVENLVCLLASGSKNTYNDRLKLQTAKCFGELGAIRPFQQKENYATHNFISTIHSNEFAKSLLKIICKYYKDVIDMRNIQALSLAVQGIFNEREVDTKHEIWKYLSEESHVLFRPLLTSRYTPANHQAPFTNEETIFWNRAQTETNWAFILAETIAQGIENDETSNYLKDLLPSMRENQEISLFLIPKIVLEYFKSNTTKEYDSLLLQEFQLIFKLVMDRKMFTEFSKEELKFTYIADYGFQPVKKKSEDNSLDKIQATIVKTAKMIFEIWDSLTLFIQRHNTQTSTIERIKHLQNQFSLLTLAEVTFKCEEYERSLVFLERYILQLENREEALSFLIKVYAKLHEPDLVDGVRWLRKTDWSISDKIFISEVTGNLENCPIYFEMKLKEPAINQSEIENIIKIHIQANQNADAILYCKNQLQKLYAANSEQTYADEMMAEPLWRLSRWDDLEELLLDNPHLKVNNHSNWNISCGNLMLKFRRFDGEGFWEELNKARLSVMDNFKIFDSDHLMYNGNYDDIIHLHMLTEFEKIHEAFEHIQSKKTIDAANKILKNLINELDTRRKLLKPSLNVIESTLAIRRSLLSMMKSKLQIIFTKPNEIKYIANEIDKQIGKTWTDASKIACKQKHFIQTNAYLIEASHYKSYDFLIEKPKYLWKKGEHVSALRTLELNLEDLQKSCTGRKTPEMIKLLSRVQLRIAKNYAEMKYVDFDTNKELFKKAIIEGAENEKCYLQLADYMDRYYFSLCENNNTSKNEISLPHFEKLLEIMRAYGDSMKYGSVHVLQSMSRFLQIWLDSSSMCEQQNSKYRSRENITIVSQMNSYLKETINVISIDCFYTAFSQLISRLCHPSNDVFKIIKSIILKLLEKYPLQSMWYIVPGLKSKSNFRQKRTSEIFERMGNDMNIKSFGIVIDRIMNFTQTKATADKSYMAKIHPEINKILKSFNILMPLQQNLHITRNTTLDNSGVLIQSMDINFEVMHSLQKPKKITFIGSDGQQYSMLLKFKDDLRIDFRFLEFVKVVNDFYRKDSDASQRSLIARTYSVIPLNEELGMIEWIPNLKTFKAIISSQYALAKIKVPSGSKEINLLSEKMNAATDKVAQFNCLKKMFPPILGQWFLHHFSSAQCYFRARQNYVKSVAIMSMIGYIMGLGDRHCENILFDIHSGEIVHVDFNCLFHKGEKLGVPERVPFRLTNSMIEAMGILGVEGPFKRCCEITLKIMHNEIHTLMSYLRPFIYDPMISKNEKENFDPNALENLQCIEKKLKGIVRRFKKFTEVPISIEGNVNMILKEATSDENLSLMYFHWSPFI